MGRKSDRKSSKHKSGGKSEDAAGLARRILQFLDAHFGEEFNSKQITKKLEIKEPLLKGGVEPVLQKLVDSGAVSRNSRNYFSSTKDPEFIDGTVDYVNARFAFIVPDKSDAVGGDIMVKESDLKQALDGDKVRVMVLPGKGKTGRVEGRVLEVLERNRDEFVGRVEISHALLSSYQTSRKCTKTSLFTAENSWARNTARK